ncbi:MAG: hypothetical protein ACM3NS_02745, partial [Deltaproteobacteria bacterium]
ASVTERSLTHVFTPADAWLLELLGHPDMPVSPTIVAIALASPLILFSWGIVTSPPEETTPDDIRNEAEKERARLEAQMQVEPLRMQLRAQQARGIRSMVAAAAGREAPHDRPPTRGSTPLRQSPDVTPEEPSQFAANVVQLPRPTGKRRTAARGRSRGTYRGRVRTGSVEALARAKWVPGMSVKALEAAAGISRASAQKYAAKFAAEQAAQ